MAGPILLRITRPGPNRCNCGHNYNTTTHHNRFTALFPGPPGSAGARRELLDFMVQGKINRGRQVIITPVDIRSNESITRNSISSVIVQSPLISATLSVIFWCCVLSRPKSATCDEVSVIQLRGVDVWRSRNWRRTCTRKKVLRTSSCQPRDHLCPETTGIRDLPSPRFTITVTRSQSQWGINTTINATSVGKWRKWAPYMGVLAAAGCAWSLHGKHTRVAG